MKEELADECNYAREAASMRSFGSAQRLGRDRRFKVPWVWEGSTDRVLVMEHVDGTSVGADAVHRLPQADRDEVRSAPILSLREPFDQRNPREDSGARHRALFERALRLSRNADRSQLVQLPVERKDASGEGILFIFRESKEALSSSAQVELVDFGATRSYTHAFIDNWLRLLLAAAAQDREGCLRWSLELGYLTGEENDVRLTFLPRYQI